MRYRPHDYQQYATRFILEHPIAAVFLQMGLGKSVITLTAIWELVLERFEIRRALVIAPLRVARDTWPAETDLRRSPQGGEAGRPAGDMKNAPSSTRAGDGASVAYSGATSWNSDHSQALSSSLIW